MDATEIKDRLNRSPYHQLHGVQVRLEGEQIVLTGVVTSFYFKQLAQEAVRSNGTPVDNRLEVL